MEGQIKALDDIHLLMYKGLTIQVSGMFEGGICHVKIIKTFGRDAGGFLFFRCF